MAGGAAASQGGAEVSVAPVERSEMLGWTLDPSSFGPLRIGMTPATVRRITGRALLRGYGRASCQSWTLAGAPEGLGIITAYGRIARIDIRNRIWSTTRGIRVGDQAWQVKRRYGVRVERHTYTRGRYLITRGEHRLVFETSSTGKVTRFRAGRRPHVEYVEGCV